MSRTICFVADLPPGADYVWLIPAGRKKGKELDPQGVRELLKRLAPLAGIDNRVYPHLLRHSL
jgi:site-specific recombinase XerD